MGERTNVVEQTVEDEKRAPLSRPPRRRGPPSLRCPSLRRVQRHDLLAPQLASALSLSRSLFVFRVSQRVSFPKTSRLVSQTSSTRAFLFSLRCNEQSPVHTDGVVENVLREKARVRRALGACTLTGFFWSGECKDDNTATTAMMKYRSVDLETCH